LHSSVSFHTAVKVAQTVTAYMQSVVQLNVEHEFKLKPTVKPSVWNVHKCFKLSLSSGKLGPVVWW